MNAQIHSYGTMITFPEKPNEATLSCLKRWGFRWNPRGAYWFRARVNGAADAIAAIRRCANPYPKPPDGACWSCGSPEGFFRNHGAATPVICAACWPKSLPHIAADGTLSPPLDEPERAEGLPIPSDAEKRAISPYSDTISRSANYAPPAQPARPSLGVAGRDSL